MTFYRASATAGEVGSGDRGSCRRVRVPTASSKPLPPRRRPRRDALAFSTDRPKRRPFVAGPAFAQMTRACSPVREWRGAGSEPPQRIVLAAEAACGRIASIPGLDDRRHRAVLSVEAMTAPWCEKKKKKKTHPALRLPKSATLRAVTRRRALPPATPKHRRRQGPRLAHRLGRGPVEARSRSTLTVCNLRAATGARHPRRTKNGSHAASTAIRCAPPADSKVALRSSRRHIIWSRQRQLPSTVG